MKLIYSRTVDKSILWDGFSIQQCFLRFVTDITGELRIGERKEIKFLLKGKIYDGIQLKNQPFNRQKYPSHQEIYQVRYAYSSGFSKALRLIYADVWNYIFEAQNLQKIAIDNGFPRKNIRIPNDLIRRIAFFTTDIPDVWLVETYDILDSNDLVNSFGKLDELNYEQYDETASVVEKHKMIRLRVLDRKIGDNLKQLYDFRCQVCGMSVGDDYGMHSIVDAHHIEPFTISLNNNFDNIMILCPNHHRILHTCGGVFHRSCREIWYPNGLHERLAINLHL